MRMHGDLRRSLQLGKQGLRVCSSEAFALS